MLRLTPVIVLLCAGAAACGSGGQNTAKAASPATTSSTAAPTTAAPAGPAVPGSADLTKRPVVVVPSGPPPTSLVITDIVTGTGATAKADSSVTVQYVGVSYTTKQPFDASWDRNQPFPFQLGTSQVIAGWEQGVVGMKVGGRRQLIIPPSLAYGPQGKGPIGPNETLIFLIDLLSIG